MAYEHAKHTIITGEETIAALREDLVGELNAINQYQSHIDGIADPEIKKTLSHITADEKEHVAELTKMIRKLDAVQEEKFKKEGL